MLIDSTMDMVRRTISYLTGLLPDEAEVDDEDEAAEVVDAFGEDFTGSGYGKLLTVDI